MALLLSADSVTKSYAGVRALKGVSFDLFEGEVHALVGENGAGKSTLIRIVTGAESPDDGTLTIFGRTFARMQPALAHQLGIAAIYQQPALCPDLTVAENIALGSESGAAWRRIDWAARRTRARDLLQRLGSSIDPDRTVDRLTMPEQQLVEIAKALGGEAKILVMDEPTASLTGHDAEMLLEVVRRLCAHGVGVIYISHRLEEIRAIADRITVVRDGETVATGRAEEFSSRDLIRAMVGREIEPPARQAGAPIGDVMLELRNVSSRAAGIRDVSFSLRRGEILGFAGLVGSGRTQLAETIFGITPPDAGEVRVNGRTMNIDQPATAIAAGIGYVPEDRRRHGVILDMPITANATLADLGEVSRYGLISRSRERDVAQRYVDRLQIKTSSVFAEAGSLSGGNQQKVALARWLSIDPDVLILDEPTQGVDVGSKAEIHQLMRELAGSGLAVIMISSELPEILAMSDRVAVMRRGRISGILPREDATPERIMGLALMDEGDMAQPA